MNVLSHRSSAHSLEPTSLHKTYSTLNINSSSHDFAQTLKGGLPSLRKKHKKTKSALTGDNPFERDAPQTVDPFVQSTGSFSHRPTKSKKKLSTDLNFQKLEEPFPNHDFHASISHRGASTGGRSRFQQVELYYNQSHPISAVQTARGSPREKEKDDLGYVKQEEYIKKNPHFQKFNDTLHRLDRAETIKFSFSKQFFWSAAQVELNEKMLKAMVRRKSNSQQQVQILKENVKESVQLLQGKTCYYKVRCEDKVFPLLVKITEKAGAFEALVSKSENILHRREYDHIFTTNEFRINYDSSHDIKFLYIAINAVERLRMCITVSFVPSEEPVRKKIQFRTSYNKSEQKERTLSHKKSAYEFFKEGMRNDEFLELKELAEDIKKEKRIKALNLANNKDLVQENIQSTREYPQSKVVHLTNLFEKREYLLKRNRENKVQVKIEKDKQYLINTFKFKIKRIEQQWNENEERKRQEKLRFQSTWLTAMSLVTLMDSIIEKKKARIIVKIFERQRETKVIRIQRLVKKFLARPVKMKTRDVPLLDNLMARIAIKMSEAFNGVAMTAYKSKMRKAEELTVMTLQMACVPIAVVSAFEKYNSTVIMIQRRWRNQMEMFHARVQVFLALWHQLCLSLITKEMKKKKKKYTEIIPLIKETRVTAYAKHYIQERITIFLREMRDYKTKNAVSDENSDDTPSAQLDKSKDTDHGDSFTVTRRTSIQKVFKDHDPPVAKKISFHGKHTDKNKSPNKAPQLKLFKQLMRTPTKPKLKAKPTEEELKEILDKICHEIKITSEVLH